GLEVGWIRRIQELDTAYWGFLGVGTTLDIIQNIILIPYLEYGTLFDVITTVKAETLKGVIINETSSAPAKGNKSSSASKVSSAPAKGNKSSSASKVSSAPAKECEN
ncbi:hypothetical protein Tco_0061581, partial [Tanacetum coccineum]